MSKSSTNFWSAHFAAIASVIAAAVILPVLRNSGARTKSESVNFASAATLEARNHSAFGQILGELRTGAADFMFVKTERYLHNGVGFAPHLDEGVMARSGEVVSDSERHGEGPEAERDVSDASDAGDKEDIGHEEHDHEHEHAHEDYGQDEHAHDGHDHANSDHEHEGHEHAHEGHGHDNHDHSHEGDVPTIIRTAENDFRGFLGNLEREIKPWQDPSAEHKLASGAELLPWYRLITLSNPRFVRAYRVGAMWLCFEDQEDKAIEFLNEGIENNRDNPERYQLYLSLVQAYMRLARKGDPQALDKALESSHLGVEHGLLARPDHGTAGVVKNGLLWTEDHEEDFVFLARFVPIILERMQRFDEARTHARIDARLAPEDAVLQRINARLARGESAYVEGPVR